MQMNTPGTVEHADRTRCARWPAKLCMVTAAVVHGFLAAYNGFSIVRCKSIIGGLYMTNYKEILRLAALGIQKQDIAASCQCSRNTVRNVLNAAQE